MVYSIFDFLKILKHFLIQRQMDTTRRFRYKLLVPLKNLEYNVFAPVSSLSDCTALS